MYQAPWLPLLLAISCPYPFSLPPGFHFVCSLCTATPTLTNDVDIVEALTEPERLGYQGWISMELFSRTMADPIPKRPDEHARRGMESWKTLVKVMNWAS
jgi:hypothetical protein